MKHTNDKGCDTLEDEDPGPTSEVSNAPHAHDAEGEQTTESAGSSSSGEEDGHAQTALMALVPHGDAVFGRAGVSDPFRHSSLNGGIEGKQQETY